MSYVTYSHFYREDADLRPSWAGPTARAIGRGLSRLAGGVLFAATTYLMVILPWLLG